MRSHDSLTRLAAVAAAAEALVDPVEEDQILERILGSPRPSTAGRRPLTLALVGIGVLAAAGAITAIELGHSSPAAPVTGGHRHVALSGATFKLAAFHFRTPAGFKAASADSCRFWLPPGQKPGTPVSVAESFAEAAAANGGCLEALLISGGSPVPSDAQPVAVGAYNGFLVTRGSQDSLYVEIPEAAAGGDGDRYLTLVADGLTPTQLIAIAESGLPSGTALPTPTCTADCG